MPRDTDEGPKHFLSALSPLTVVIVLGFSYRNVSLPDLVSKIESLEADQGVVASGFGAWIGSPSAAVCLWAFVGLIIAKDWYFKTERARVWANLACVPLGALTYLPLAYRLNEVSRVL